jgi:phage baseplate assembly protein W
MNSERRRSWRFVHPDFAEEGLEPGISISSRGGLAMVEQPESIRQAILILLTTLPGERVMRPTYGCDLFKLVFSPNDETTAGLAIHFVRKALERWEPRVEILHLDATRNGDQPDRLEISLEYRIRAIQRTDQIAFSINLAEGRV